MSDTGTELDVGVAQISLAERVVNDPVMKGSIAYYGSMLLLAKIGRTEELRNVMPDLVEAIELAIKNIKHA